MSALDLFFIAVTQLGEEWFYIVAISVIYWAIDKKTGKRLMALLLTSLWLNCIIKDIFKLPRPPVEERKISVEGYGFPSGHSQGSTTLWGYLTLRFRNKLLAFSSVIIIALVSYSRIYLRVHYWYDVVGGIVLGLIIVMLFNTIEKKVTPVLFEMPIIHKMLTVIIISALMIIIPLIAFPSEILEIFATLSGIVLGAGLGFICEERSITFLTENLDLKKRAIRITIGLLLIFGIIFLLKAIFPHETLLIRCLRYALLGFIMSAVIPLIFKKIEKE
ncbi:MAG: phosphatase PAP2 family protein [Candidatus Odinarchaeota archaeon]|nr:phosphatase PAP2 family protein [Candidatus Odinarchaeota archaeon]